MTRTLTAQDFATAFSMPDDESTNSYFFKMREDLGRILSKYQTTSKTYEPIAGEDYYRGLWRSLSSSKNSVPSSILKYSVSSVDFGALSDKIKLVSINTSFICDFDPHSSAMWHAVLLLDCWDTEVKNCYPILILVARDSGYPDDDSQPSDNPYKVMFYYGLEDQKIVDALVAGCHSKNKEERPTISYLCQNGAGLFYRDTPVRQTGEVDLLNYNEDFEVFDKSIKDWAAKEESCGLSILHGEPGTGKTYYLRHLAGHIKNLTYIPSGIAGEIGSPSFILFLSENPGRVFVIEDAEGVLVSDGVNRSSALQNLLNATDGLMGDIIKSKFIFTFNTGIENIDKALLRAGRAAVVYKFDKLSEERTAALCEKLGREKRHARMTLAEIYNADVSGVSTLQKEQRRIGFGK